MYISTSKASKLSTPLCQSGIFPDPRRASLSSRAAAAVRQYLYFCTSMCKASKLRCCARLSIRIRALLQQCVSFCTFVPVKCTFLHHSTASKLRCCARLSIRVRERICLACKVPATCLRAAVRQYLYICTSKASKLRCSARL